MYSDVVSSRMMPRHLRLAGLIWACEPHSLLAGSITGAGAVFVATRMASGLSGCGPSVPAHKRLGWVGSFLGRGKVPLAAGIPICDSEECTIGSPLCSSFLRRSAKSSRMNSETWALVTVQPRAVM